MKINTFWRIINIQGGPKVIKHWCKTFWEDMSIFLGEGAILHQKLNNLFYQKFDAEYFHFNTLKSHTGVN